MGNHVFWPDGDFSAAPTAESGRSFQRDNIYIYTEIIESRSNIQWGPRMISIEIINKYRKFLDLDLRKKL